MNMILRKGLSSALTINAAANYFFHLTPKSANVKTGPMPVSTSSAKTCPNACPFKKMGCYGDGGPLNIHWQKVTEKKRGDLWGAFLDKISNMKKGQIWRHNQVGDLVPRSDCKETIDGESLKDLVKANKGRKGFTYSHFDILTNFLNRSLIAAANKGGFTINVSGNSLEHVDKIRKAAPNLPAVTVLPAEYGKGKKETLKEYKSRLQALPFSKKTPAGNPLTICPATFLDSVNCLTCKVCQVSNRKSIIGFPAHGTSNKKASAIAAI